MATASKRALVKWVLASTGLHKVVRKEALYSAPYDAVILDLTLPGMDGRDILREWREKGQREPVLILTARDALAERVEGLRLGADDYLCKPLR